MLRIWKFGRRFVPFCPFQVFFPPTGMYLHCCITTNNFSFPERKVQTLSLSCCTALSSLSDFPFSLTQTLYFSPKLLAEFPKKEKQKKK